MWRKVLVMAVALAFVGYAPALSTKASTLKGHKIAKVKKYGKKKIYEVKEAKRAKKNVISRGGSQSIKTELGPVSKGDTLGYDDGSAENAWAWYHAGNGWGVKFTPANYPVYIDGALLYFWGSDWPSPGGDSIDLRVLDDDGTNGAPQTVLYETTGVVINRGSWNYIPIPGNVLVNDGSFYIFYIQHNDYPNCPGLAIDTLTTPPSGTQWEYFNSAYDDTANVGGAWMIRAVVSMAGDSLDPMPPTDVTAYSDYTMPTSIAISWTDPTHYVGGDTLTDFYIELWLASGKDSTLVDTVSAGVEADTLTGLTDGTLYTIYLRTVDANDSTSSFVSTSWYAGGSPYPAPPSNLVGNVVDESHVELIWINPSTQSDGTPLDDLAGINIYVDGTLNSSYTTTDAGVPCTDTINVTPGTHSIYVTAFDNETPVHESDPSNTVSVVTNAHSGGPDGFGYTFMDSDYQGGPSFNWIDITSTGTPLNLGDDDHSHLIDLGFNFPFYDTVYTQIDIQSNGTIIFADDYVGIGNEALPSDAYGGPWDLIAFYWSDQNPSAHGQVYFQSFGTYAVIEFNEVPEYGGSTYNTYEVILYQNGDIDMNYLTITDYSDETIGIQDASAYPNGDWFLQYTYNGDPLVPHDSLTVHWSYPSFQHDVAVASINEPIPGGNYDVNDVITPNVTVANNGTSTETFNVTAHIYLTDSLLYTSTTSVTLEPDSTADVTFADFTVPSGGFYTFEVYTELAGDANPHNDTLRCNFVSPTFVEDFEANNGGFIADPYSGAWEWGTPTVGPSGAHSGVNVWGTVLSGDYDNDADWRLYSPDLQATSDNPVITFWHWYDIEDGFDGGNVAISTDGGATWTVIEPVGGYPGSDIDGLNGESGYTGQTPEWEQAVFVLNGITAGTMFKLRFRFGSDASVTHNGWYIDDFSGIGCEVYLPDHDVGAISIITPSGRTRAGQQVVPIGIVRNYGVNSETFDVIMTIDSLGKSIVYSDTQSVTLDALSQTTVLFDPWMVNGNPGDEFNITMVTILSNDENANNDTTTANAWIPTIIQIPMVRTAPTLDGVIDSSEWSHAIVFDVGDTLGRSGVAQPPGANMMYLLCDTSYIYFAFDVTTDNNLTDFDQIGLYLDDNGDGDWAADGSEGSNNILPAANIGWASRTITPGPTFGAWVYPRSDRADCFAISDASGHVVYEIRLPYGDETTPDPAFLGLSADSVFGIWIMYSDETSNEHHIWWPQAVDTSSWADPSTYALLKIGPMVGVSEPGSGASRYVFKLIGSDVNPVGSKGGKIFFSVPKKTNVKIELFDAAGRKVEVLANKSFNAGVHSVTLTTSKLESGVYFVRMESENYHAVKKLMVIK